VERQDGRSGAGVLHMHQAGTGSLRQANISR